MPYPSFDEDRKWCPKCSRYVQYLQSIYLSYCIECGGKVELFDPKEEKAFQEKLQRTGPKSRS